MKRIDPTKIKALTAIYSPASESWAESSYEGPTTIVLLRFDVENLPSMARMTDHISEAWTLAEGETPGLGKGFIMARAIISH